MPRYDYRCASCEYDFELVQKFSEAGSGVCPMCGAEGRRVFHAVPVIYKGSGFYTTDYARPKPPTEKETAKKESKDSSDTKAKASSDSSNGASAASESAPKVTSEAKSS